MSKILRKQNSRVRRNAFSAPVNRRGRFFVCFLGICMYFIAGVHAQELSLLELDSELYIDLLRWESGGYIETLPVVQPYSHLVITTRMRTMLADNELPEDIRKKAERYLSLLSTPDAQGIIGSSPNFRVTEDASNLNMNMYAGFRWLFDSSTTSSTWAEFKTWMQFLLLDSTNNPALPAGQREPRDWLTEGPSDFDLFGRNIQIQPFPSSVVSFSSMNNSGTGIFSVRAGIHRSNVGPFYDDGIIISAQTPAAGHFGLSYEHIVDNPDGFNTHILYNSQLSVLSATDDNGAGNWGEKFLMFHSIHADFLPWLRLGYFESVIWGGGLELTNLIPLSSYFFNQGLSGFEDNSIVGIEATFRPIPELKIPLVLFVDDLGFDSFLRLDFNTMYKFAAQAGIAWAPLHPWLDQISFDYTAVMPYMYTHWGERTRPGGENPKSIPNTTNYTHRGTNIGPGLEPNSDRWRIDWTARPLTTFTNSEDWFRDFSFAFGVQLIRHGNASEGVIGHDDASGDIFDTGYIDRKATFTPEQSDYTLPDGKVYTRFMTQDVIEHNVQFSLAVNTAFQITTDFQIDLELQYTHEEIWNHNLVKDARKSANYFGFTVGISN